MRALHIGYPKTGTTYLQSRVLGPLHLAGMLQGYAGNNGRDRSHKKRPLNFAFASIGNGSTTDYQAQAIRSFFCSTKEYFVSVEATLGNFRAGSSAEFAHKLSRHVPKDTEIVITLRQFGTYFDSAYQQEVKGDFLEDPKEFFTGVGPKKRHKLRRHKVLSLVKYDLDALVSALLERFEAVVLIDVSQEKYLIWLAEQIGATEAEIRTVIASTPVTTKNVNASLSRRSVKLLEFFNLSARYVFLALGISQLERLDPIAKRGLRPTEALRHKLVYAVIRIKSKIVGLLRVVDSRQSGAEKYTLPKGLRDEILGRIPESKLALQVKENGGFLKIGRALGLQYKDSQ